MLLRTLLNIIQNDVVKDCLSVILNVAMAIIVIMALLMTDAQEIEFIYANF